MSGATLLTGILGRHKLAFNCAANIVKLNKKAAFNVRRIYCLRRCTSSGDVARAVFRRFTRYINCNRTKGVACRRAKPK